MTEEVTIVWMGEKRLTKFGVGIKGETTVCPLRDAESFIKQGLAAFPDADSNLPKSKSKKVKEEIEQ